MTRKRRVGTMVSSAEVEGMIAGNNTEIRGYIDTQIGSLKSYVDTGFQQTHGGLIAWRAT